MEPAPSQRTRDPGDDVVIFALVTQEMKSSNNSQKVQIAGGCSKFLPIASCTAASGHSGSRRVLLHRDCRRASDRLPCLPLPWLPSCREAHAPHPVVAPHPLLPAAQQQLFPSGGSREHVPCAWRRSVGQGAIAGMIGLPIRARNARRLASSPNGSRAFRLIPLKHVDLAARGACRLRTTRPTRIRALVRGLRV
jgi:hypothetical protein